jgi:hypothetical protein
MGPEFLGEGSQSLQVTHNPLTATARGRVAWRSSRSTARWFPLPIGCHMTPPRLSVASCRSQGAGPRTCFYMVVPTMAVALRDRTALGILLPTPPLGVSDFPCYHYTRRKLFCCSEDSHLSPHFPKLLEVTGSDVHDHHLLSYLFRQLDMLVSYTKQQLN